MVMGNFPIHQSRYLLSTPQINTVSFIMSIDQHLDMFVPFRPLPLSFFGIEFFKSMFSNHSLWPPRECYSSSFFFSFSSYPDSSSSLRLPFPSSPGQKSSSRLNNPGS
ncbi:hypothetical protein ABW19_dt0200975 [Dactylella cylindrospora]|nr:hypothetical protein ABW19_dt0200975 [Dactylella cylindrospora]